MPTSQTSKSGRRPWHQILAAPLAPKATGNSLAPFTSTAQPIDENSMLWNMHFRDGARQKGYHALRSTCITRYILLLILCFEGNSFAFHQPVRRVSIKCWQRLSGNGGKKKPSWNTQIYHNPVRSFAEKIVLLLR